MHLQHDEGQQRPDLLPDLPLQPHISGLCGSHPGRQGDIPGLPLPVSQYCYQVWKQFDQSLSFLQCWEIVSVYPILVGWLFLSGVDNKIGESTTLQHSLNFQSGFKIQYWIKNFYLSSVKLLILNFCYKFNLREFFNALLKLISLYFRSNLTRGMILIWFLSSFLSLCVLTVSNSFTKESFILIIKVTVL